MSDLFFDSPEKNTDVVIEQALGSPLVGDPGRAFVYSNLNYVLLGRLAGWRMGMPWFAAVQRLVLDPLGIEDWLVGTTSGHEDGDALHTSKEGRNYMELLEGAGAWLGRASDVALILDALNEGSFFRSPATSRLMRQPSSAGPPNEDWTYGLGLRIFPSGLWGHSGTLEAAHDMVVSLPDGTVVAVLVNGEEPSDSDSLIETIVRALEPRPDPAPSTTAGP
jgi:D-alanyl-D-alanine carboxypeptidase